MIYIRLFFKPMNIQKYIQTPQVKKKTTICKLHIKKKKKSKNLHESRRLCLRKVPIRLVLGESEKVLLYKHIGNLQLKQL